MPRDHLAATRHAYSDSAHRFATAVGTTISADFEAPIDLAVLDTFVELAHDSSGVVVDAGCGTGRVARHLVDSGLDVLGVDVATGMIAEARRAHPDIAFDVAELTRLPLQTASVTAIAYWYSIITTPPDALDEIWSELRRSLAPGGVALVAFQCGRGEHVLRPNAYGTTTGLTLFRTIRATCARASSPLGSSLTRMPSEGPDSTMSRATRRSSSRPTRAEPTRPQTRSERAPRRRTGTNGRHRHATARNIWSRSSRSLQAPQERMPQHGPRPAGVSERLSPTNLRHRVAGSAAALHTT